MTPRPVFLCSMLLRPYRKVVGRASRLPQRASRPRWRVRGRDALVAGETPTPLLRSCSSRAQCASHLWLGLALLLCLAGIVLLPGCAKKPVSATLLPGARVASLSSAPSFTGEPGTPNPALGGLPSGSEELWILARGGDGAATPSDEAPGPGALMAKVEEKQVPMPLKHTDVRASISGYIGAVEVTQQFLNPTPARSKRCMCSRCRTMRRSTSSS